MKDHHQITVEPWSKDPGKVKGSTHTLTFGIINDSRPYLSAWGGSSVNKLDSRDFELTYQHLVDIANACMELLGLDARVTAKEDE